MKRKEEELTFEEVLNFLKKKKEELYKGKVADVPKVLASEKTMKQIRDLSNELYMEWWGFKSHEIAKKYTEAATPKEKAEQEKRRAERKLEQKTLRSRSSLIYQEATEDLSHLRR